MVIPDSIMAKLTVAFFVVVETWNSQTQNEMHPNHHSDVIMSAMAILITRVSKVRSTVCAGADQRKHQSFASLAFVRGIHRWPVNSPHKGPVTQKMFPFDDVIMQNNYSDVKMSAVASRITGVSMVGSTACLGADQRIHHSSTSLVFGREIHRWPANSPHKGQVTRKIVPFDDVSVFGVAAAW